MDHTYPIRAGPLFFAIRGDIKILCPYICTVSQRKLINKNFIDQKCHKLYNQTNHPNKNLHKSPKTMHSYIFLKPKHLIFYNNQYFVKKSLSLNKIDISFDLYASSENILKSTNKVIKAKQRNIQHEQSLCFISTSRCQKILKINHRI